MGIDPAKEYLVFYLPHPRPEQGWGARRSRRLTGKYLKKNPLQCQPGRSYVETFAVDASGPPDLMISYCWRLDWSYLVAFLKANFEPTLRVWIDILACSQSKLEEGDMAEIQQVPDVINFAGKTLVMPGGLDRMWCICKCGDINLKYSSRGVSVSVIIDEFAWTIECNGGNLFYGYSSGELQLDNKLATLVAELHEEDKKVLLNRDDAKFLSQASCWKAEDEEFITKTIETRLGGQEQVTQIVKKRLRDVFGLTVEKEDPKTDREALVSVFEQSGGVDWKNKENWLEPQLLLSEWHGVGTNDTGVVTKLDLQSNRVEILGPAVGFLKSLTELNISGNDRLTGLPEALGELKQLQTLNCNRCLELKSLPETLGHCKMLKSLQLRLCKQLQKLPDTMGALTNLESLVLTWSEALTELTSSIGELRNLRNLVLRGCEKLTTLPETISGLTTLQTLRLASCIKLRNLPERIGNLEQLQILDCSCCYQLTSLPDSAAELENLNELLLPENLSFAAIRPSANVFY